MPLACSASAQFNPCAKGLRQKVVLYVKHAAPRVPSPQDSRSGPGDIPGLSRAVGCGAYGRHIPVGAPLFGKGAVGHAPDREVPNLYSASRRNRASARGRGIRVTASPRRVHKHALTDWIEQINQPLQGFFTRQRNFVLEIELQVAAPPSFSNTLTTSLNRAT